MRVIEKIVIEYLSKHGYSIIKPLQSSKVTSHRNGMYGELDRVKTGKFEICMMTDKEEETHLWIESIDGEGTEVYGKALDELNEFLEKWFDKIF